MNLLKWGLAIIIGGFLLMFGATKFTGGAHIFPYIEYKALSLGFPAAEYFFPYVNWATGLLEILAGVLVIIPMTRHLGARLAVLPFAGAVGFHLSPLLGIVTPNGYAENQPVDALAAGGPFAAADFSSDASPVLFSMAAVMLVLAIINVMMNRR